MSNQMNRQYPMVAVFDINMYDFKTETEMVVGNLPDGASIMQSYMEASEAFDTSALTVVATNSTLAIAGLAAAATARVDATALDATTGVSEIKVTRSTDTDTTGKAILVIAYVEKGRANEVQP